MKVFNSCLQNRKNNCSQRKKQICQARCQKWSTLKLAIGSIFSVFFNNRPDNMNSMGLIYADDYMFISTKVEMFQDDIKHLQR